MLQPDSDLASLPPLGGGSSENTMPPLEFVPSDLDGDCNMTNVPVHVCS